MQDTGMGPREREGDLGRREVQAAALSRLEHEEGSHHGLCILFLEVRIRKNVAGDIPKVNLRLKALKNVQV